VWLIMKGAQRLLVGVIQVVEVVYVVIDMEVVHGMLHPLPLVKPHDCGILVYADTYTGRENEPAAGTTVVALGASSVVGREVAAVLVAD